MPNGDFESILDRSMDEVTEPKLYPTGTWRLRAVATSVKKDDNDRDVVMIALVGVEPQDDVDPDELAAAGGDFDGQRIWLRRTLETKADVFNLKRLIEQFGVETAGKSLREGIDEVKGHEVMGYVGIRSYQSQGETKIDNTVKQFAPVE